MLTRSGRGSTQPDPPPAPQLDGSSDDNLDLPLRGLGDSSADLSCDSRVNSDYETDGEGGVYTDGDYTDGEGGRHTDGDEEPPVPALARSSEPVLADEPPSPRGHRAAQVSRARGAGTPGDPPSTRCLGTEASLIRSESLSNFGEMLCPPGLSFRVWDTGQVIKSGRHWVVVRTQVPARDGSCVTSISSALIPVGPPQPPQPGCAFGEGPLPQDPLGPRGNVPIHEVCRHSGAPGVVQCPTCSTVRGSLAVF